MIDEEFATQADFETTLNLEALGREAIENAPTKQRDGTVDKASTEMLVEQLALWPPPTAHAPARI